MSSGNGTNSPAPKSLSKNYIQIKEEVKEKKKKTAERASYFKLKLIVVDGFIIFFFMFAYCLLAALVFVEHIVYPNSMRCLNHSPINIRLLFDCDVQEITIEI